MSRGASNFRRAAFSIIVVCMLLIVMELCSFIAVTRVLRDNGLYYFAANTPEYLVIRRNWHPEFGWPSPATLQPPRRDSTGARKNPNFPADEANCVSAYGESVVYGYSVPDELAWSNLLSDRLGCRVANFGVPSYGADQALMRFRSNDFDVAPVVILGMSSAAVARSVSQFRALLPFSGRERERAGFKPRFIVNDSGALEFIRQPLNPLTEDSYQALVSEPESHLEHDYFRIDGEGGLIRPSFPYTMSLANGIVRLGKRFQRRGSPWYAGFYERGHASDALRVTASLMGAFAEEARENGQQPVVVMFPTVADLQAYRAGEGWHYQSLLDELDAQGVAYINLGDTLLARTGAADPCAFYDAECNLHFDEDGAFLVTDAIHAYLKANSREAMVRAGDGLPYN